MRRLKQVLVGRFKAELRQGLMRVLRPYPDDVNAQLQRTPPSILLENQQAPSILLGNQGALVSKSSLPSVSAVLARDWMREAGADVISKAPLAHMHRAGKADVLGTSKDARAFNKASGIHQPDLQVSALARCALVDAAKISGQAL